MKKKLLIFISLIMILAMLPFALFSCDSDDSDKDNSDNNEESEEMSNQSTTGTTDSNNNETTGVTDTEESKSTESNTKATEEQDENPLEKVIKDRVIALGSESHADKVKKLGRTTTMKTSIACDHTASGIEFNAYVAGGSVKVKIKTLKIKDNSPKTFFTVFVDGERLDTRFSVMSTSTIEIKGADGKALSEGNHTIRIVKQTEANYTLSEMQSISFKGYLLPPPADKKLYIEFIGDSLTCGMGNIGTNSITNNQSAQYEDGSQSYGYITADSLDADYSIISESGIGISGAWSYSKLGTAGGRNMVEYYPCASYVRSTKQAYTFDRVPDLVVINLGTNDFYINNDKEPKGTLCTTAEVRAKTKELISLVRSSYGSDVPILWVGGLLNISYNDKGKSYVAAFEAGIMDYAAEKLGSCANIAAAEAVGIYRTDVSQNTDGADAHPSVAGHKAAAQKVVTYINQKNLLK